MLQTHPLMKDRLADQMAVIGFGLAVTYWLIRTLLFVMTEDNTGLLTGVMPSGIGELSGRLLTLCFFMIFASHANYTIKQRKLADEARVASESKYRTIIESIEDGYFEIDLDGGFTFCNDSMARMLSFSPEEGVKMRIDQSMPGQRAEAFRRSLAKVKETGQPVKSLGCVFDVRGTGRLHAEASIAPIYDARGEMIGFRGLVRDLTERIKSEALEREKQSAEAASRSKSEFLANMSHEIRTPLNSIIGMVELLRQGDLSEEQQEDLEVVHSASYALLSVINDILDFSKIEAGKLELEATVFNIRAVVEESMKIMAPKAHQKGLDLACRIAPDIPASLVGDPSRLRQVILNLLGNAVKFTDHGEIVLELSASPAGKDRIEVHLSLRDTGIGIDVEKQATIFQAFSQADSSTSRRFGGTGLGLAVSAQLVALMEGRIWVESQPQQGSTFHFTARFGGVPETQVVAETHAAKEFAGVRALVVDDHPATREFLCDLLKQMDIFPAATADADQARDLLQERAKRGIAYEVVFVDTDLADDAGLNLVRWLRAESDLPTRPVLLTTHSGLGYRSLLAETGAVARIVKPAGIVELRRALAKALGQRGKPQISGEEEAASAFAAALHVLVAEDLPFNQRFILRLLEKWGHRVEMVVNGRQAVAAAAATAYDLILMDVQMPELDGIEATRQIREMEISAHRRRTPIIAMTAHAMKGDRERCLEAGMDDYVSKPIMADQLRQAIQKAVPGEGVRNPSGEIRSKKNQADGVATEPAAETSPAQSTRRADGARSRLDFKALLEMVGGDIAFLKELIETFLTDAPERLRRIDEALGNAQTKDLGRAAHDLKGMLRNFDLKKTAAIAERLERLALKGPWNQEMAEKLADALKKHLPVITRAVRDDFRKLAAKR